MKRNYRNVTIFISILQIIIFVIVLILLVAENISLDCMELTDYKVSSAIQIVENCRLNYLIVFHLHYVVSIVAVFSGLGLLLKRKWGWIGSAFVHLTISILLIVLTASLGFPVHSIEIVVIISVLLTSFSVLIVLFSSTLRKSYRFRLVYIAIILGCILIELGINYYLISQINAHIPPTTCG
jgi:hypothetical protein